MMSVHLGSEKRLNTLRSSLDPRSATDDESRQSIGDSSKESIAPSYAASLDCAAQCNQAESHLLTAKEVLGEFVGVSNRSSSTHGRTSSCEASVLHRGSSNTTPSASLVTPGSAMHLNSMDSPTPVNLPESKQSGAHLPMPYDGAATDDASRISTEHAVSDRWSMSAGRTTAPASHNTSTTIPPPLESDRQGSGAASVASTYRSTMSLPVNALAALPTDKKGKKTKQSKRDGALSAVTPGRSSTETPVSDGLRRSASIESAPTVSGVRTTTNRKFRGLFSKLFGVMCTASSSTADVSDADTTVRSQKHSVRRSERKSSERESKARSSRGSKTPPVLSWLMNSAAHDAADGAPSTSSPDMASVVTHNADSADSPHGAKRSSTASQTPQLSCCLVPARDTARVSPNLSPVEDEATACASIKSSKTGRLPYEEVDSMSARLRGHGAEEVLSSHTLRASDLPPRSPNPKPESTVDVPDRESVRLPRRQDGGNDPELSMSMSTFISTQERATSTALAAATGTKPPTDFLRSKYIKEFLLGRGAFGEAFAVSRNEEFNSGSDHTTDDKQVVAGGTQQPAPSTPSTLLVAKVIDLHLMSMATRKYAQQEIMCVANSKYFGIISYVEHAYFESSGMMILVTEYADRGDLNSYIKKLREKRTQLKEEAKRLRVVGNLCKRTQSTKSTTAAADVSRASPARPADQIQETESTSAHATPSIPDWKSIGLTEREAGIYFVQLILGLDYVHRHRMIHRDVKSANLFLTSKGLLKLGDFGFSQQYDSTVSNPVANTFLGTPYYLSPEMWLGQRYGKKADIWAAGIVLCELLMLRRPFLADTLPELKAKVLSGDYENIFDDSDCDEDERPDSVLDSVTKKNCGSDGHEKEADLITKTSTLNSSCKNHTTISSGMREIVMYVLQRDPQQRPSASQLLRHPLMQHYLSLFENMVRFSNISSADGQEQQDILQSLAETRVRLARSRGSNSAVTTTAGDPSGELELQGNDSLGVIGAPGVRGQYEGIVFKESTNSTTAEPSERVIKERYLILDSDGYLTLTLTSGKQAARGGTRCKKIPVESIQSVIAVSGDEFFPEGYHAFAISTSNSSIIVLATKSTAERDLWVTKIMEALNVE